MLFCYTNQLPLLTSQFEKLVWISAGDRPRGIMFYLSEHNTSVPDWCWHRGIILTWEILIKFNRNHATRLTSKWQVSPMATMLLFSHFVWESSIFISSCLACTSRRSSLACAARLLNSSSLALCLDNSCRVLNISSRVSCKCLSSFFFCALWMENWKEHIHRWENESLIACHITCHINVLSNESSQPSPPNPAWLSPSTFGG